MKRLRYIAYLQIIDIMLVVAGHSFHEYPDGMHGATFLPNLMAFSFRMPLFIFISGFLMAYTTVLRTDRVTSPRKFIYSKVKRLLVPFFTLSLVIYLPRVLLSGLADDEIELSVGSFLATFFYADRMVHPFLWFIQASFFLLVSSFLFLTLAGRLKVPEPVTYTLLTAIFITPLVVDLGLGHFWSMHDVGRLGIYFVLGILYCRYGEAIDSRVAWTSPLTCVALYGLWAALYFAVGGTALEPLCALAGIAGSISLAKIIDRRGSRLLDALDGTNYIIFLLSWFFNVGCQQVLHHFTDFPWWVYSAMSLFFGIFMPWAIYRLLQRNISSRWARSIAFLLGQNIKPKG